jgi:sodium-dependent dicarboxylate transporter 2/3/5
VQIPYAQWMIFFFFVGMLMVVFEVLAARFIIRLDVTKLKELDPAIFGEKKNFTKDQKIAISGFLLFVVMALLSSFLPATNPVAVYLNKLTIFGQTVIVAALLMLLKKDDGTAFFNFNVSSARGLSWDVVFMVSVIMPLAQFLCAADTGVSAMLAMLVYPLQALPPMVFIIAVMVLAAILTNFANNFVIGIIIMPVLATFAGQMGMGIIAPIMILIICTQIAFATPGASFPAGLAYSFAEIVDAPMMMKYAWILVAVLTFATLTVAYPFAMFLF